MGGSNLVDVKHSHNEVKQAPNGGGFTPLTGSVIVIGGGTSAAVFAATAPRDLTQIVMINIQRGWAVNRPLQPNEKRDVWNSVPADHRMGQIPQLLNGNVFNMAGGSRARPQQIAEPQSVVDRHRPNLAALSQAHAQPHLQGFVSTAEFRKALEDLIDDVTEVRMRSGGLLVLMADWISAIGLHEGLPFVKLTSRPKVRWFANHVVVATGPGEENKLDNCLRQIDNQVKESVTWTDKKLNWRDDGCITSGGKFMEKRSACEPTDRANSKNWNVLIYGGSATASWAAETALLRGYSVAGWWARRDNDPRKNTPAEKFAPAFPAGDRNLLVHDLLSKVRHVCTISNIDETTATGRSRFLVKGDTGGKNAEFVLVDQIVMCLGSDNEETFKRVFGDAYRTELGLRPKYDRNFTLGGHNLAEQKLLGFGTAKNEILILGSAVATAKGLASDHKVSAAVGFGSIAGTLPMALAPDQGIGVLTASIEAFNDFMPVTTKAGTQEKTFTPSQANHRGQANPYYANRVNQTHVLPTDLEWKINFNTANQTQLAAFFASEGKVEAKVANYIVPLIVGCRALTTHGLTQTSIDNIVAWCQKNIRVLESTAQAIATQQKLRMAGEEQDLTAQVIVRHAAIVKTQLLATDQERAEYGRGIGAWREPVQVKK